MASIFKLMDDNLAGDSSSQDPQSEKPQTEGVPANAINSDSINTPEFPDPGVSKERDGQEEDQISKDNPGLQSAGLLIPTDTSATHLPPGPQTSTEQMDCTFDLRRRADSEPGLDSAPLDLGNRVRERSASKTSVSCTFPPMFKNGKKSPVKKPVKRSRTSTSAAPNKPPSSSGLSKKKLGKIQSPASPPSNAFKKPPNRQKKRDSQKQKRNAETNLDDSIEKVDEPVKPPVGSTPIPESLTSTEGSTSNGKSSNPFELPNEKNKPDSTHKNAKLTIDNSYPQNISTGKTPSPDFIPQLSLNEISGFKQDILQTLIEKLQTLIESSVSKTFDNFLDGTLATKKFKFLNEENESLKSQIQSKDKEISKLNKKISELTSAPKQPTIDPKTIEQISKNSTKVLEIVQNSPAARELNLSFESKKLRKIKSNLQNKDTTMQALKINTSKKKLSYALATSGLNIKIDNCKETKNGEVIINSGDKRLDQLTNLCTEHKVEYKILNPPDTIFKIQSLYGETEPEDIMTDLLNKNLPSSWTREKLSNSITFLHSIKFTGRFSKEPLKHQYFKASEELSSYLLTAEKIYIGPSRYNVIPTVIVTLCANCGSTKHSTSKCTLEKKGPFCFRCTSHSHKTGECKCKNEELKCMTCRTDSKKELNHRAGSFACPLYKDAFNFKVTLTKWGVGRSSQLEEGSPTSS